MSAADIKDLEASLLCVPIFPELSINITDDELQYMTIMMNHVTIEPPLEADLPISYLHLSNAIAFALTHNGGNSLTLSESVNFIEQMEPAKLKKARSLLICRCNVHQVLNKLFEDDLDFGTMLQQLQKLDIRERLKDQSGAHCMTVIINFLIKRQQFKMQCFAKEACLQVSCMKYN